MTTLLKAAQARTQANDIVVIVADTDDAVNVEHIGIAAEPVWWGGTAKLRR